MDTPTNIDRAVPQNRLLLAMPQDALELMLPRFEPFTLELREMVYAPMTPISEVYFPTDGAISILAVAGTDESVEVGTIGFDGFAGLPLLFGVDREPFTAITQAPAKGVKMRAADFVELTNSNAAIRSVLLRYAQSYRIQAGQASACNRSHSLEERCARWLLQMHDRAHLKDFILTHDFLAAMLGVRRAGVTVAAGNLQQAGLIRYKRGLVSVLDRERLEAAACDCYGIVRETADTLFPPQGESEREEVLAGQ
ncbi:MAG TPA: Crp/Fnr family transcriptional regulator [Gemmatimonadaceae bacterium]|nr:Crp/Fnr family transcriptional regulator [Gemmatimonadaceae bacterium]